MQQQAARAIELRQCRDDDIDGIAALQAHVDEGMRLPPAAFARVWRWLYQDNPMGPRSAIVAQASDGRIVGHEGIMPFRLRRHGEPLLGGISCNLIVDEDLRQTLLFPRIVKKLIATYREAGFDFVYGPARPHIARALVSLGYRDMGPLPVYVRPFRFGPFMRRFVGHPATRAALAPFAAMGEAAWRQVRPPRPRGIAVTEVDTVSPELGAFADAASARFPIHAVRNAEIMRWRYYGNAERRYRLFVATAGGAIVGYMAIRRMPMLGFSTYGIVDLLVEGGASEAGHALLRRLHDLAVAEQLDATACMIGPSSPVAALLRRAGYVRSPEAFSMVLHQPPGEAAVFGSDDLGVWYATWYDHDYV